MILKCVIKFLTTIFMFSSLTMTSCVEYNCTLTVYPFVCMTFVDQNNTPMFPDQVLWKREDDALSTIRTREMTIDKLILLSGETILPFCLRDDDHTGTYIVQIKFQSHTIEKSLFVEKIGCHAKTHDLHITIPFTYCEQKFRENFSRKYDFSKSCK